MDLRSAIGQAQLLKLLARMRDVSGMSGSLSAEDKAGMTSLKAVLLSQKLRDIGLGRGGFQVKRMSDDSRSDTATCQAVRVADCEGGG